MKKLLSKTKLVALLMVCCIALSLFAAPMAALAGDVAVVNNPNPKDRLNLRATASTGGASLGKYFNGVELEMLDYNSNTWAKVRIGGVTGYMMKDYLAVNPSEGAVKSAIPTVKVANPNANDRLNLRESPSDKSGSIAKYDNGTEVKVLAVAGAWYHVAVDGKIGYMMAKYLTNLDGSDNGSGSGTGGNNDYKTAIVNNPNAKDRLNLRATASTGGTSLGKYFNGVEAEVLPYSSSTWVKVRIAGVTGYMMKRYLALDAASGSVKSAIPEVTVKNPSSNDRLNLRKSPSDRSESLGKYSNGTKVNVLGVAGEWYHVAVGSQTGYMMAKFLTGIGGASGGTGGTGGSTGTKATVNNPNANDRLNLRSNPYVTNNNSMGKYYNGVEVVILSDYNAVWAKVRIGKIEGYMQKEYLSYSSGVKSVMPIMKVKNPGANEKLNLRATPSQKAAVVSRYGNNTKVEVLGVAGEWYHVKVGSQTGYMMAKYLKD